MLPLYGEQRLSKSWPFMWTILEVPVICNYLTRNDRHRLNAELGYLFSDCQICYVQFTEIFPSRFPGTRSPKRNQIQLRYPAIEPARELVR